MVGLVLIAMLAIWWNADVDHAGESPPDPAHGLAVERDPARPSIAEVEWVEDDCWFDERWSEMFSFHRHRCAWLYPSTLDSRAEQAALPVVILHQQRFRQPTRTATVYIMGGPGGSSWLTTEGIEGWEEWSERLGLDHDLVLYDQRGTGYSYPPLDCPEMEALGWEQLDSDQDDDALWADYERVVKKCAEQVPARDRADGLYSTRTNARDLLDLLHSLKQDVGYEQVNIYGASYGTRLAMIALADADNAAASAVLDSLYPPGLDLEAPFADHFAAVIDAAGQHCIETHACDEDMQLRKRLDQAVSRLGAEPARVQLSPEWLDHEVTIRIDDTQLMAIIEHAMYAGWELAQLNSLLSSAAKGDFSEWTDLLDEWLWVSMDPDFDLLTLHLVECRDNPPLDPAVEAAALARQPTWSAALKSPQRSFALCDELGVKPAPLSPTQMSLPVLALAADYDPRTPAEPGLEAVREFPQVQILRRPLTGHGLVDFDDCAAQAAGRFLNKSGRVAIKACKN